VRGERVNCYHSKLVPDAERWAAVERPDTYMSCLSRIVALCNRQTTDRQTYVHLANTHYTVIPGQEQCSAAQNDTKTPIGRRAICTAARPGDWYALPGRPGRPANKHCTTMLFCRTSGAYDGYRYRLAGQAARMSGPDVREQKSAPGRPLWLIKILAGLSAVQLYK